MRQVAQVLRRLSIMFEPTYFARIVDGFVEGVYVADAVWVSQQEGEWLESTDDNRAYKGAPVIDGIFVQPVSSVDAVTDTFTPPVVEVNNETEL